MTVLDLLNLPVPRFAVLVDRLVTFGSLRIPSVVLGLKVLNGVVQATPQDGGFDDPLLLKAGSSSQTYEDHVSSRVCLTVAFGEPCSPTGSTTISEGWLPGGISEANANSLLAEFWMVTSDVSVRTTLSSPVSGVPAMV